MSWYDKLDLEIDIDLNSLRHQVSGLIGEASNLLENANNLDILNLDALAKQQEQQESQYINEDEEDEDEEGAEGVVAVVEEGEGIPRGAKGDAPQEREVPSMGPSHGDASRCTHNNTITETSIVSHTIEQHISGDPVTVVAQNSSDCTAPTVSDRLAADTIDSSMIVSPATHISSPTHTVKDQIPLPPTHTLSTDIAQSNTDIAMHESGSVSHVTTQSVVTSSSSPLTTANQKGKSIKPLKPRPKNLDFFGMSSNRSKGDKQTKKTRELSNTLASSVSSSTAAAATAMTAIGSVDGAERGSDTTHTHSVHKAVDNGVLPAATTTTTVEKYKDNFYGPVGLFGDDSYAAWDNDYDDAKATGVSEDTTISVSVAGENSMNSMKQTSSDRTKEERRLPLGWFSGIHSSSHRRDDDNGSNQSMTESNLKGFHRSSAVSFFDDIDEIDTNDDPILKQVEYNRQNPQQIVTKRGSALHSTQSKILEVWNSFMKADAQVENRDIENASKTVEQRDDNGSKQPQQYGTVSEGTGTDRSGVGPVWAVSLLSWYRYITGVTVTVLDGQSTTILASCAQRTSTDSDGNTNIFASQTVEWRLFRVEIHRPSEWNFHTIATVSLQLLRIVGVSVLSVVLRVLVLVLALLTLAFQYLMHTIWPAIVTRVQQLATMNSSHVEGSSSEFGTGARLRRFLTAANSRLDSMLGRRGASTTTTATTSDSVHSTANAQQSIEGDSTQTTAENSIQTLRSSWRSALNDTWSRMNSANGLLFMTAALFIFSYYKFQRYGTDTGD